MMKKLFASRKFWKDLGIVLLNLLVCFAFFMLFYKVYGPIKYTGPHMDMYTVAVNNVFGITGHANNGEVSWEAHITVLEEDKYGRVLFLYDEHNVGYCSRCGNTGDCYGMAYCILQKSDGEFSWFYQDACYMHTFTDDENADLAQLKLRNDWDLPLNLGKCAKAPYTDQKPESAKQIEETVFAEAMRKYLSMKSSGSNNGPNVSWVEYCNTDLDGNACYFVNCWIKSNITGEYLYKDYAVIVRADGTIQREGILQVVTCQKAWDTVQKLKEANGWVYP